jgi:hypothetical protein
VNAQDGCTHLTALQRDHQVVHEPENAVLVVDRELTVQESPVRKRKHHTREHEVRSRSLSRKAGSALVRDERTTSSSADPARR